LTKTSPEWCLAGWSGDEIPPMILPWDKRRRGKTMGKPQENHLQMLGFLHLCEFTAGISRVSIMTSPR
jgi:hypothetical protein